MASSNRVLRKINNWIPTAMFATYFATSRPYAVNNISVAREFNVHSLR